MPLLNIHVQRLVRKLFPKASRKDIAKLPVRERIQQLAARAAEEEDHNTLRQATAALRTLEQPAFIGLSAVRTTLQVCNAIHKCSYERFPFLAGTAATEAPQSDGFLLHASWPRQNDARWLLTITGDDIRRGLS